MAALASSVDSARLGVCVTDAIRRSPATLVLTALTLDHLAPGRIVLGLGAGEIANYVPYGVTVRSPATVLERAAKQIRRLLDDPGPDERGAAMGIRPPPGSCGPALWIAAHGPRGLAVAGQFADGWIPNFVTRDEWRRGRDVVAAAARGADRDPDNLTWGLSVQVVIQDDHDDAAALLEHPVLKAFSLLLPESRFAEHGVAHPLGGGGLGHMIASLSGSSQIDAARAVPGALVREQILHGTSEEVADQLRAYGDLDHVVLWDPVPLADLDAAKQSAAGVSRLAALLQGG
jgi:phthiodiolone/phenolphthiodiolone dimycocerosates ketoreductase